MATATASYTLVTTAYTALSTAGTATVMVTPLGYPIRLAIATSLPAVTTDSWFPVEAGDQIILRGLGASDVVYGLVPGSHGSTVMAKVMTQ